MTSNPYQPPSEPPQYSPQSQTSGLAIATIICGLGSWFALPFFAAVIGAITGWIELSNIQSGRSSESNRTMTQIGFWASILNLVMTIGSGCAVAAFSLGIFALIGVEAVSGQEAVAGP